MTREKKEDIFIAHMKVTKRKPMKIFVIIAFFKKNYAKREEHPLGMILLSTIIKWVLLVYIYTLYLDFSILKFSFRCGWLSLTAHDEVILI